MNATKACKTCKYFFPLKDDQGECRYMPPHSGMFPEFLAAFPKVGEDIWCGRFDIELRHTETGDDNEKRRI